MRQLIPPITDFQEKPDLKCEVFIGIYVIKASLFELIPNDIYYCIDDLIKDMLQRNRAVARYPSQEFWLDVGHVDDYRVAQESYSKHFATLKEEVGCRDNARWFHGRAAFSSKRALS